ncbi:MAG: TonB-dependent receptor [Bacteroidales bacterium]|nr:TonB-dependent receptor [Bacteroidales bacterium]MCF8402862.1 TonB-dependent receptor [Bacteroidales bacterium]
MQYRNPWIILAILLIPVLGFSQYSIRGKVIDKESEKPLPGAHIILDDSYLSATSGGNGYFIFNKVKAGLHRITVSFMGYKPMVITRQIEADTELEIALEYTAIISEEVIIQAVRVDKKSPTTVTSISREQISANNSGQDLPYILQLSPSTVTSSDAGAGVGYTGIRIRGTDISRINVTMNGVPINDAESHGVYFVDLPDLASSVDNIQVQRGVGTSTNGAAAFGASINIQTSSLQADPFAEVNSQAGSFNTFKNTVSFGSGLIDEKWAFDGRLSSISSDGYINRGWSDLRSFYLSGGYYGEKTIVKAIITSGKENTYQAWYGISKEQLETDRRYNPAGEMYGEEGELEGFYHNQTDNYQQDYYQLHLAQKISDHLNLSSAVFYTKGKGYYENYRNNKSYSSYGLENVIIGSDTLTQTNMVDQKWLDNDFYGINLALKYNKHGLKATLGSGLNFYEGGHYGYIVWAQNAGQSFNDTPWYRNTGNKRDLNLFGKIIYELNPCVNLYADMQYRGINYEIVGVHDDLRDLSQMHTFNFFNPKTGVSVNLDEANSVYASVAVANREPNRSVYRDADPGQKITHETLTDYELGYKYSSQYITIQPNMYFMDYQNQLVLTGQINNVGDPILVNVPESYRLGLEVVAGFRITKKLSWDLNTSFSQNKIKNFTSFVDNWSYWDDPETQPYQYEAHLSETDISFSPNIVAGSRLTYKPVKGFAASLVSRYVGKQYIDNTSNDLRSIDPYFVSDIKLNYEFETKFFKKIGLMLSLNNIFNEEYESNAWVYRYVYDGTEGNIFGYFPQAKFHFMGGVNLKF